jgi:thiamine kinase-like enzyme
MEFLKDQGLCNKIYLQNLNGHLLAVKECLNKEVDHRTSYNIQKRLSLKKIAPNCISFDGRFIKYTYIEGKHLVSLNQVQLKRVAITLKKMHKTKARSKRVNLKKLLPRYQYTHLQKIKKFKSNLALTHNDLNPKNLIFTKDHLYLIDFEYAGVNDIYFDLASICVEFRLNTAMQNRFLKLYFQSKRADFKKLNIYKKFYKEALNFWFYKNMLK